MGDETNHKLYSLVLTAITKFCKIVVYILDDIIVLFYQCLYDILHIVDI